MLNGKKFYLTGLNFYYPYKNVKAIAIGMFHFLLRSFRGRFLMKHATVFKTSPAVWEITPVSCQQTPIRGFCKLSMPVKIILRNVTNLATSLRKTSLKLS